MPKKGPGVNNAGSADTVDSKQEPRGSLGKPKAADHGLPPPSPNTRESRSGVQGRESRVRRVSADQKTPKEKSVHRNAKPNRSNERTESPKSQVHYQKMVIVLVKHFHSIFSLIINITDLFVF